jgi:hypothetical protein
MQATNRALGRLTSKVENDMPKGLTTNLLLSILAALKGLGAVLFLAEHINFYHPERTAVELNARHGSEA